MKILYWIGKELLKIYSDEGSFFSKKRLESGFAFLVAEAGLIIWFFFHIKYMTIGDIIIWSSVNFSIAGYIVHLMQKRFDQDIKKH